MGGELQPKILNTGRLALTLRPGAGARLVGRATGVCKATGGARKGLLSPTPAARPALPRVAARGRRARAARGPAASARQAEPRSRWRRAAGSPRSARSGRSGCCPWAGPGVLVRREPVSRGAAGQDAGAAGRGWAAAEAAEAAGAEQRGRDVEVQDSEPMGTAGGRPLRGDARPDRGYRCARG